MKTPILQFRPVTANPKAGTAHHLPAPQARRALLVLLASLVFVATAHAGLHTVAQVNQVSFQILVQVCRLSATALQIFCS